MCNIDKCRLEQHQEKKYLDTIPDEEMMSFFTKGKNLRDIMDEIESKYGWVYRSNGYIFNYLDKYDFEEYIYNRFQGKIRIEHVVQEEQLIIV